MRMQKCKKCMQMLPITEYWKKSERKNGYELACKTCLGERRSREPNPAATIEGVFHMWRRAS